MTAVDLACLEKLKAAEEEIEQLKAEVARLQAMVAYYTRGVDDVPVGDSGRGLPFFQPPKLH